MAFLFERWKLFSIWLVILNEWLVLLSVSPSSPVFVWAPSRLGKVLIPVENGLIFVYDYGVSIFFWVERAYDFVFVFGVFNKFSVEDPDSFSVANVLVNDISVAFSFVSFKNSL